MRKGWIAVRRRKLGARVRLYGMETAKNLLKASKSLEIKSKRSLRRSRVTPRSESLTRDGLTPLGSRTLGTQFHEAAEQRKRDAAKARKKYPTLARKISGYKVRKKPK